LFLDPIGQTKGNARGKETFSFLLLLSDLTGQAKGVERFKGVAFLLEIIL